LKMDVGDSPFIFSPDEQLLFLSKKGPELEMYEVDPGLECRMLQHTALKPCYTADFSPDSRLLVTAAHDGIRFWETDTGREVDFLKTGPGSHALFTPQARELVHYDGNLKTVFVRPLRWDTAKTTMTIAAPTARFPSDLPVTLRLSGDGSRL